MCNHSGLRIYAYCHHFWLNTLLFKVVIHLQLQDLKIEYVLFPLKKKWYILSQFSFTEVAGYKDVIIWVTILVSTASFKMVHVCIHSVLCLKT